MTSFRKTAPALALLALLATVAFADVANARRQMGWAKELIDRDDRLDEALRQLVQAEQALTNVPDAEKAPVMAEIQQLRDEANRKQKDRDIHNADSMLEREYTQLEEAAKGEGRVGAGLREVNDVEPLFVKIENMLRTELVVKAFEGTPKMTEWRQKVDSLRGVAMRTVFEKAVTEAETWLQKIEERNAGGQAEYSEESVEQWFEIAAREVEKLPGTDPRKLQLEDRTKAARSACARRLSGNAKETAIGAVREWWAHNQRQYQGAFDGWERENARELSQFWRDGQVNLERTEKRWDMANAVTQDDRWTEATKTYGDDARVKALVAEVGGISAETSKKICAACDRLLEGVEGKVKEDVSTAKERAERLVNMLEKYSGSCPEGAPVLARGRALLTRIHEIEVNGSDPGPSSTPTATASPAGTTTPPPAGSTPATTTPATGAPTASSGFSFVSLFLGCFCCVLSLAVIGGGVFFVMKQQKAAAAGAAPPKV